MESILQMKELNNLKCLLLFDMAQKIIWLIINQLLIEQKILNDHK